MFWGEPFSHLNIADQKPRECWCSRSMKKKAITLNGTECNSPCDGDSSMACGGREELSVYKLSRASQMHVSTLLALCALTLVTLL